MRRPKLTWPSWVVLDEPPTEGDEITFVVADVYEDENPPRIAAKRGRAKAGVDYLYENVEALAAGQPEQRRTRAVLH